MVSLSRDGLKEVCSFFSFLLELLGQLISEHKLSDEDPLASMYHGYQQDFVDCERFAARSHVSQGTRGVGPSALEVFRFQKTRELCRVLKQHNESMK